MSEQGARQQPGQLSGRLGRAGRRARRARARSCCTRTRSRTWPGTAAATTLRPSRPPATRRRARRTLVADSTSSSCTCSALWPSFCAMLSCDRTHQHYTGALLERRSKSTRAHCICTAFGMSWMHHQQHAGTLGDRRPGRAQGADPSKCPASVQPLALLGRTNDNTRARLPSPRRRFRSACMPCNYSALGTACW